MLVIKSNSSLLHKSDKACIETDESKTRHLNIKKQLDAYKVRMADSSQIHDGHDVEYKIKSRRNSGLLRAELDKKFSCYPTSKNTVEKLSTSRARKSSDPPIQDDLNEVAKRHRLVADVLASFVHFNQDVDSSLTIRQPSKFKTLNVVPEKQSTLQVKESTPSAKTSSSPRQRRATVASDGATASCAPKTIRRKKSCPQHRDREMNQNLSGIIKSPRYLPSRPGQLSRSMQETGGPEIVDERLSQSMNDLDFSSRSIDFNSVHFRNNVEVYCFKP
jgi:hypothetical protein